MNSQFDYLKAIIKPTKTKQKKTMEKKYEVAEEMCVAIFMCDPEISPLFTSLWLPTSPIFQVSEPPKGSRTNKLTRSINVADEKEAEIREPFFSDYSEPPSKAPFVCNRW